MKLEKTSTATAEIDDNLGSQNITTFVLDILLFFAFLKLSSLARDGWLENRILMKTQSSNLTWTLDFDFSFVIYVYISKLS